MANAIAIPLEADAPSNAAGVSRLHFFVRSKRIRNMCALKLEPVRLRSGRMRGGALHIFLSAAFLLLSCASAQRKEASTPNSQPPLPRSSIAAVLQHKEELQLTDDQIHRLQDLDDQLEKQNAPLRVQSFGGGFGRGMGGRSRAGMGGRSFGGGTRSAPSSSAAPKSAVERMDENDTNAYLEAEKVLTESQRARATEIASKYREELWDRRHAARKPSDQ